MQDQIDWLFAAPVDLNGWIRIEIKDEKVTSRDDEQQAQGEEEGKNRKGPLARTANDKLLVSSTPKKQSTLCPPLSQMDHLLAKQSVANKLFC